MLRNQPSRHLQSARDGTMKAASLPNEGQFAPGSFLEKLNSLVKGIGCPSPEVGRAPHKAFDKRWASLPHPAPPPAEVPVTGSSSCSNGLPAVVPLPVSARREPVTKPIAEASVSSARGSRTAACPPLAPAAPRQASSVAQEPSPQAALELQGSTSSLDEQAQQLDAEINELIQQWELRPEDEEWEDTASSMLLKSKWCRGDPMDLDYEFIREDPAYDTDRVESEAREADDEEGQAGSPAVPPSSPSSPAQSSEAAPDSQGGYSLRPRGPAKERSAEEEEGDTPAGSTEESSAEEEEGDSPGGSTEESSAEEEEEEDAEPSPQRQRKRGPQGGTAPRVYPCPTCGQKFANSSNMRKHLRIHTREALYSCHACGKSFTDSSNLTKHQRVHSGGRERPFSCSKCPKVFASAPDLQEHLRRHEGIRPFPCMDCKRSFVSQAELLAHIRSHVGQLQASAPKPLLRCEDCDKSFASPMLLRLHQRRHKAFVCDECGAVFTLEFKLLFHKSLHKGAQTCTRCGVQYMGGHFCRAQAQARASRPGHNSARTPGTESLVVRVPDSVPAAGSTPARPPAPLADGPSGSAPAGPPAPLAAGPPGSAPVPLPAGPPGSTPAGPAAPAPLAPGAPARAAVRPHSSTTSMTAASLASVSVPLTIPPSDPVTGVISNGLILLNPATLPPGTKIILQIPPQMVVPPRDTGTGAGSTNACTLQGPVPRRMPELRPAPAKAQRPAGGQLGDLTSRMSAEKGNGPHTPPVPAPSQPLHPLPPSAPLHSPQPLHSPPPPATLQPSPPSGPPLLAPPRPLLPLPAPPPPSAPPQLPAPSEELWAEQGAWHKSYNFRQSQPQGKYTEEGAGEGSDLGESSGEDWAGESGAEEDEELEPVPQGKRRGRPPKKQAQGQSPKKQGQGQPPKKRRRGRPPLGPYICVVCAKRFVYQRSLKQHMRLRRHYPSCHQCHSTFSDLHKLQLHMLSHRGEGTA